LGDRLLNTELSGAFGSIRIGRDNSLNKMVYDGFDAGGSNNVRGVVDAISGTSGAIGTGNTELEYDPSVTVIRYTTPAFSGLTVAGGVIKSTVTEPAKDDVKSGNGYEAGINYAAGPFKAGLAYRKAEQRNLIGYTVSSTDGSSVTYTASTSAQNLEDKVTNFGASYDLGMATAFFQYMDGDRTNITTASNGYKEELMTVGIRANVGATTVFASVTDGERKPSGAADLSREGYQVGAMYNFSKRTRAYVAFGADEFNTSATAKTETDQTVFGIVHTF
jgi:predicted porin